VRQKCICSKSQETNLNPNSFKNVLLKLKEGLHFKSHTTVML